MPLRKALSDTVSRKEGELELKLIQIIKEFQDYLDKYNDLIDTAANGARLNHKALFSSKDYVSIEQASSTYHSTGVLSFYLDKKKLANSIKMLLDELSDDVGRMDELASYLIEEPKAKDN